MKWISAAAVWLVMGLIGMAVSTGVALGDSSKKHEAAKRGLEVPDQRTDHALGAAKQMWDSDHGVPKPSGIYVLNEASNEQSTATAYAPGLTSSPAYQEDITGHAIFVPIAKILPSITHWGYFNWDWTYLDTLVQIAVSHGKKFSIELEVGFQSSSTFLHSLPDGFAATCGPDCAPLFDVWVTGGSGGRCISAYVPLPWVPRVQQFWARAAFALAAHLRQTGVYGDLTLVHVPGLSVYDEELRLPTGSPSPSVTDTGACPDGRPAYPTVIDDASPGRWQSLGYSDAAVIDGFKIIAAAFATAFPDRVLGLSLFNPGPHGIDFPNLTNDPVGYVASQIVQEVNAIAPGRVQLQSDNLDSNFAQSEVIELASQYSDGVGWQTNKHAETGAGCNGGGVNSCNPDGPAGPYFQLLQNGALNGGRYLEVWSNDVVSYPQSFAAAKSAGFYSASCLRSIASISVCSPSAADPSDSCPDGTRDTSRAVLSPNGDPVNNYGGLTTLADEHSTIFPPGLVPGHGDYLFFVAARTNLNPISSGVVVLTGGSGPDANGQWTLDFARDYGRYYPRNPVGQRNGQVFLSPMEHRYCPSVSEARLQDQTFDLNYADPGTVVLDPTNRRNGGPGSLIMIYEGTNRCIGLKGGDNILAGNSFYSTIAVATSDDFGHTWPSYRYMLDPHGMPMFPLPSQNPSTGPEDPLGATGRSVCIGNDCTLPPWLPNPNYGRYAVLHPEITIADAMKSTATRGGLQNQIGDAVPSAFVDDIHDGHRGDCDDDSGDPIYLYEVHNYAVGPPGLDYPPLPNGQNSDLMIARARLNGGTALLDFKKWYQGSFSEPGMGGFESPIFPSGPFENCEAPGQLKTMGAISYVEETHQYLLTFVCISPHGDPSTGAQGPGAAWFFSTNDDLSRQNQWSLPQEIIGSWARFDPKSSCNDYSGWYPSFMSLRHKPGHLSTRGYVFYMNGCSGGDTEGSRVFSTREFTMTIR